MSGFVLTPVPGSGGGGDSGVDSVARDAATAAQAAATAAQSAADAAQATANGRQPSDSDLTAIAALTTTSFGRALLAAADAAALRTAAGLGTAATANATAFDAAGAAAAAQTASQPVDSDLTAIAALTTTSFGRALLTAADAAALRTAAGLGTAATAATGDFEVAGAASTAQAAAIAASQPVDSDLTAIAALTTTSFGRALLTAADAAALRTAAGLGTAATQPSTAFEVAGAAAAAQAASQPIDSDLTAIAALTTTSYGRALLALADAAALRTAAGLGTAALAATGDFQPVDSDLTAIAALTTTTFGRSLLTQADAAAARATLALLDSSTLPLVNGLATAGSATQASPRDHVHPRAFFGPEDLGLIAMNFDQPACSSSAIPTSGTLHMIRLKVPKACTISTVHLMVATAGVALTAGQSFAGLFDSSRVLLSSTADQSTAWTSVGTKAMALATPQAVAAGDYFVGFYWAGGTTGPGMARGLNTTSASIVNAGLTGNNSRFASSSTGLTTALPATAATLVAHNSSFWAGVS